MTEKLYVPGLWLPTDHVLLHQWGVKKTGRSEPCPREGFRRLIKAFDAGGRQPMTQDQIRAVIKGEETVSAPAHAERKHSTIGASGFSRWSVCPGSVVLSQDLPSRDSEYSLEGTRAHELLEQCMRSGDDAWMHAADDGVTEEMVDGVQMFLDTVRADLKFYESCSVPAVILIEQQFSLEALGHPDAFGTADVAILFPAWGLLRVYDFKYGAGIVVDVEDNGQLRYYAVGMALAPEVAGHQLTEVENVVVQPRCEHEDGYVRRERLTIDELNQWVEKDLLPAIECTQAPDAPLVEGPHCRFCPVKQAAACPLLDNLHNQLAEAAEKAKDPAKEARLMEDWELAERLARVNAVEMFIKAMKDEAFLRLQRGAPIPGWKLVPKKSNRVLKDGAEEKAREQWGDGAYETRLKSPAQLEKLKGGKEWCAEWAFKPDTGLTIAPDTDRREGVKMRTAKEVFAGQIEGKA